MVVLYLIGDLIAVHEFIAWFLLFCCRLTIMRWEIVMSTREKNRAQSIWFFQWDRCWGCKFAFYPKSGCMDVRTRTFKDSDKRKSRISGPIMKIYSCTKWKMRRGQNQLSDDRLRYWRGLTKHIKWIFFCGSYRMICFSYTIQSIQIPYTGTKGYGIGAKEYREMEFSENGGCCHPTEEVSKMKMFIFCILHHHWRLCIWCWFQCDFQKIILPYSPMQNCLATAGTVVS